MSLIAITITKGDSKMTQVEATNEAGAESSTQEAKPKATRAPHKPHVAPKKGQSARKATQLKRARKSQKEAKTARTGTKKEKLIALMQRSEGATLAELIKASGWNGNSVRGFISGQLGKKMNLKVTSSKREDGPRCYQIAS
jgi:hypothetical protein